MRSIQRIAAGALGVMVLAGGVLQARAAEVPATAAADAAVSGPLTQVSGMTVTAIAMPLQGENLIAGRVRYVIEATKESGICPEPAPGMVACLAATRLDTYRINVLSSTQVLDRNRRTLQGMPEIGDRINAYGRLSADLAMDAQIVRDTDKPLSTTPVQLEDLRVISITQGKDGVQLETVRGAGPCWQYGATSRLSTPCPAGSQPAPTVRKAAGSDAALSTFYSITVPRGATVLRADRRAMSVDEIKVDHRINAYGIFVARGILKASVVRDLSVTGQANPLSISIPRGSARLVRGTEAAIDLAVSGGTQPYTWTATNLPAGMSLVTQGTIACLVAPCPQPTGDTARIVGTPTKVRAYDTVVVARDAAGRSVRVTIPFTVVRPTAADSQQRLAVSVATDKDAYGPTDVMKIDVTLKNAGTQAVTKTFTTGCQADYDVLPGFSLRTVQLCMLSLTSVTLQPGETKTYSFEHDLAGHALPRIALPATFTVVGRVTDVGEASKKVTLRPAVAQ